MAIIRVADHAPSPGGRFVADGPFSGEWFRNDILSPALASAIRDGKKLTVELDGTSGYGSSFLEEAFGGLIRERGFTVTDLDRHLLVVARTPLYKTYEGLVKRYIQRARSRAVAAA
jgi:hypothetical protein